jgi:phosphopantetheinyl transferase (holo-ACP synthase)
MTGKTVLKTRVIPLSAVTRLRKNKTLLKKTFTPAELRYAMAKRFPEQSLGARLAAKKAFFAALTPKKSKLFFTGGY